MKEIDQRLSGFRMPAYVEEILTHHYCPYFMRMSIIRDKDQYRFLYRPGSLAKINMAGLSTYDKLVLIRSLISISTKITGFMLRCNSYLLEPELIYSYAGRVTEDSIRIMFYPDVKNMDIRIKLMLFSERIRGDQSKEERELFNQLRELLESEDINRAALFLDKVLLRMEGRMLDQAG
ncbi:MAG: hypothetical protein IJH90_05870 [Mogibacterium sp.]|nr:hypothetical protein [Mogibacterium sp.]